MIDTLVLVSFNLKCPDKKLLNDSLHAVAEYQWMSDDTFMLLGLRCELEEGRPCSDAANCPMRNALPLTLNPIDLQESDHYLCYTDYEEDETGRTRVVADCKKRFILSRNRAS